VRNHYRQVTVPMSQASGEESWRDRWPWLERSLGLVAQHQCDPLNESRSAVMQEQRILNVIPSTVE